MRSLRTTVRAVAVAVAVTAGAWATAAVPAAADGTGDGSAGGHGRLRVAPAPVGAGGLVWLTVSGCRDGAATATSTAFAATARLTPSGRAPGELTGPARIGRDPAEGTHIVYAACGVKEPGRAGVRVVARAPLTVAADAAAPEPGGHPPGRTGPPPAPLWTVPAPVDPVRAGGGGAARRAEEESIGPAEAYGLALAGGAALVVGARAVRRGRAGRAARSRPGD
ncbi:hypothetical protein [Streptomyces pactum]|uniref:hypothetical protein n=1 Tax=Streptomyces pactum TaxID=68249 RepID=UPI0036FFC89F